MSKYVLPFLSLAWCLLMTGVLGRAQAVSEPPSLDNDCNSLGATVEGNVKAIAGNLGVCRDLKKVLFHVAGNALASVTVNPEVAAKSSETNAVQAPDRAAQFEGQRQQFEARQHINEAATRAVLDLNAMMLQVQSALLQYQMSILVDEKRAYNRTKLLNAFLGTTVGVVGTGMQFSNSTRVQHAGDAVGVAGGLVTVVFALCTAELAKPDPPAANRLFQSFANGNHGHVVPADVWNYLQSDKEFVGLMEAPAKAPPTQKKALSCHFKAPDDSKQLAEREEALSQLNSKLTMMNNDVADLLKALPAN